MRIWPDTRIRIAGKINPDAVDLYPPRIAAFTRILVSTLDLEVFDKMIHRIIYAARIEIRAFPLIFPLMARLERRHEPT